MQAHPVPAGALQAADTPKAGRKGHSAYTLQLFFFTNLESSG